MTLMDRFKEKELVRANFLAAERTYAVGNEVEIDGVVYRVTRHRVVPTVPWATFIVYGRPA